MCYDYLESKKVTSVLEGEFEEILNVYVEI
jgi:hypothetical protein